MASNQTEHYGLNQWEGSDSFLRAEFNEDNRKIDAAMKQLSAAAANKADRAETAAALTQKCEIFFGTYTGNDSSQHIYLGYRPKAVLAVSCGGLNGYTLDYMVMQLASPEIPGIALVIDDTGFTVSGGINMTPSDRRSVVNYLVFR
ncbi:MAG: hypothetical protein EOM52_08500 [Clostridia bacterium]|nr:hypothetical protein [Clostridia bacterium]